MKATTDLRKYGSGGGWIEFAWMKGLTLTGGGTFDGRGAHAWPHNKCITNSSPTANFFQLYAVELPLCRKFYISFILANSKSFSLSQNLKFVALNKTVIRGLTSVNSKFFHIALVECHNFKGSRLRFQRRKLAPTQMESTSSEALASTSLRRSLLLVMTASQLDKETLRSP